MNTENPVPDILTGTDPIVTWLLPGLLAQGSLVVLAGDAGIGKSTLCYALGFACATGTPLLGYRPVMPLRVLYFDQENSRPDRDAYMRWAWYGLEQPSLEYISTNFWTRHFELGTSEWFLRAGEAVQEVRPHLIFLDTATPCCNIMDENDNGIATQVINRLRTLQAMVTPTAAMIVLKHAKSDTDAGHRVIRGAKAWAGASDAVWFHVRSTGHPRKDDLSRTRIEPNKTRAFGLRESININPSWVGEGPHRGLRLDRA